MVKSTPSYSHRCKGAHQSQFCQPTAVFTKRDKRGTFFEEGLDYNDKSTAGKQPKKLS